MEPTTDTGGAGESPTTFHRRGGGRFHTDLAGGRGRGPAGAHPYKYIYTHTSYDILCVCIHIYIRREGERERESENPSVEFSCLANSEAESHLVQRIRCIKTRPSLMPGGFAVSKPFQAIDRTNWSKQCNTNNNQYNIQ